MTLKSLQILILGSRYDTCNFLSKSLCKLVAVIRYFFDPCIRIRDKFFLDPRRIPGPGPPTHLVLRA
jgi:hypothetical protein